MNRLRTFILLAAFLALATAFAACGGGDDGGAESVLDEATFQGVESGDLDLNLTIDATGQDGGDLDVSLSGPFQGSGKDQPPRLAMTAQAHGALAGEQIDFDGGLVLLPNKAYVNYEGTDYEVDPTTYSFVKSTIEEAQKEGGQTADVTGCQEAASGLEVADFVENLTEEGKSNVGGTSTTKVSGDLDVGGTLDALIDLIEEPACKSQLTEEGPFSVTGESLEEARDEVETAVKSAHVEVDVGEDDIVRRLAAQISLQPEAEGNGPESADIDFDLTLNGVNEDQSIVAPAKSKPLSKLFLKLGINPIELLGLIEGGGGAAGLGDLLGQVGGGSGSSGGQSYTECLQGARSAADIQKCGAKLG
jgi:hypothetical protein